MSQRARPLSCAPPVASDPLPASRAPGSGDAVDTTGAGDLWASGFLFGLVNGYTLEQSGGLGSACGYEVCQVIGMNIPEQGWHRIKKLLEE